MSELLNTLYASTFGTDKRLFILHLATAAALGVMVLRARQHSWRQACSQVLSTRTWRTPSARADYQIILLNLLIFIPLTPWLPDAIALAQWGLTQVNKWFGRPMLFVEPPWIIPFAFTLCLFLLDDFARYWLHRLMHRLPALWYFHAVHHSARTLTPLTVLRAHPVEVLLFSLRSVVVNACCLAVFFHFFPGQISLITLLGANVFNFGFNLLGSNLRHSHIYWRYWPWLEGWLISPAQHQIHHSARPRHYDKNFGAMLAIWDRLFGTLYRSDEQPPKRLGTHWRRQPGEQSLLQLYVGPFRQLVRRWTVRPGQSKRSPGPQD